MNTVFTALLGGAGYSNNVIAGQGDTVNGDKEPVNGEQMLFVKVFHSHKRPLLKLWP